MRDHKDTLEALGLRVYLLSFGQEWQAKRWLEETDAPFPLLLDPDRSVYRAYGLERSAAKSWQPKILWYSLRLILKGRKLRPIQGDPHQLGGDFIVDREGTVRLACPSEDPVDRPSIDMLLQTLQSLEAAKQKEPRST